jgi:hypothetical protein
MLQASDSWRPWWDGDPAQATLVSVAERAVRQSAESDHDQFAFDESNGLLIVLAGSMIFDLLRQLGDVVKRRVGERSSTTEFPRWTRDETWSSDEASRRAGCRLDRVGMDRAADAQLNLEERR